MRYFLLKLCLFFEGTFLHIWVYIIKKEKPCKQSYKVFHLTPSEGIEPPAEEPESSVLSITPRGQYSLFFVTQEKPTNCTRKIFYDLFIIQITCRYFNYESQSLYLTILDYYVYDNGTADKFFPCQHLAFEFTFYKGGF